MAEKQSFPMFSEKSWWILRNQFKKTIPSNVNSSYLKSLLGLTNEQSAKNLIAPMRLMNLIDDEGKPTQRSIDWRNDDKYITVCEDIIKDIYPQELIDLFPNKEVDTNRIKSWFMDKSAIGESAAYKVSSTFILLKNATPKTDTENTSSKKPKDKKQNTTKSNTPDKKLEVVAIDHQISIPAHNTPTIHLDFQVHISPDASPEQIDKIFESMARHLYGRK